MRTFGIWLAGLLALAASAGGARAEMGPNAKSASEQVEAATAAAYRDALARFDAMQSVAPGDVPLAVERCEFISSYTDDEYGVYVESAAEDYAACERQLDERFPKAPEVALFKLGHLWDDDKIFKQGQALLEGAKAWPAPLRARLYAQLAGADTEKAEAYTLEALRLDPKVKVDRLTLARAWLHAGQPVKASEAMQGLSQDYPSFRALRFDIALARKDWPAAVALVDVTDTKDLSSNLKRFGQLATAAPSTMFSGQMPVLLLAVLAMGAGLAMVPLLLLIPVHYRGLSRRLQHRVSQAPIPRVTLWHAWYGAALALAVPTVLTFFIAPQLLDGGKPRMEPAMFSLMLWSTCVSLVAIVPVLGVFGRRALLGDRDVWRRSWKRILGYWAVLLAIVFTLNVVFAVTGMDTSTEQTRMVAALAEQAKGPNGVMLTMCMVALLGPIFEEFVFRGLLLNGMARHLDFRWANAIQAFLFACMHTDPPRFAFYFAMGLFGGWLVRRTGCLAPAIALHVLNNAWAIGLLIAVS